MDDDGNEVIEEEQDKRRWFKKIKNGTTERFYWSKRFLRLRFNEEMFQAPKPIRFYLVSSMPACVTESVRMFI